MNVLKFIILNSPFPLCNKIFYFHRCYCCTIRKFPVKSKASGLFSAGISSILIDTASNNKHVHSAKKII